MSQKKNVIEEQSINDINYELLKKQFPHAVSVDEDGKYVIDPEKLQMSLDPSKAEIKEDGYGLNWVGKKEAYHSAFSKNYKVLKPLNDDKNSKNWDMTDNILIKGDNLDALKILRQNYFESIKMIYIDPPYNTKNDGFVYNDDFTSSTEQTLEELGYDKEYIDYIENIQGAKTHSGWLSFMYPRLLLARDLLKDDGVIFISIDDNEVAQLKILCDEIFSEENFVAEFVWNGKSGSEDDSHIRNNKEYILCYSKFISEFKIGLDKKVNEVFNYYDEIKQDYYKRQLLRKWGDNSKREDRPNLYYSIKDDNNNDFYPTLPNGEDGCWRWSKETMQDAINERKIEFAKNSRYEAYEKIYKSDNSKQTKKFQALLLNSSQTSQGTKEIKDLFNEKVFERPKPTKLLKDLMLIANNKNDIVLDFFAGSGTTAHAVMDLNTQDGGDRKFITVQWAEETSENSEAKKAGYETIFDITQERIKRAGDKIAKGDIGFRTFEIVEDQKQKIYQKSLEEVNQDDLVSFMEKPDIESNEEILYNLFVAETLALSTKHEELIKDKLYLASNVAFILGDITSDELVVALKDKKECEYITVYSPNISNDKLTLEIESNISKIGIKSDKLRFRG
jgi:adenine-specific DNA-methyltransferase